MIHIPQKLIERLRTARHVVVLTGAGVSAESGIPTFRDTMTGLWERYNAEDLATREAFRRDPRSGLGLVRMATWQGAAGPSEPGAPRHRSA